MILTYDLLIYSEGIRRDCTLFSYLSYSKKKNMYINNTNK